MDIPAGEAYEFDCVLPLYGGEFRVVVEGMLSCAQEVYGVKLFGIKR